MMRTLLLSTLVFVLVPILPGHVVWAQIPQTISFQGVLTDANGNAVPDGNYNITSKLYDDSRTGNLLWSEALSVAVSKGIFNVILGTINPLNLAFDKPYWLGITVGAGTELTPRIELTSSADSLNARSIAGNAVTSAKIASGQVVKSLNSLRDDVVLAAGDNVSITPSGNTLTIAATPGGGGGDITAVNAGSGLAGDTPYWPMVGYDEAHTNWNSQESDLYPPFPVEIVLSADDVGIGGLSSSDGILYVAHGGDPNQVKALDISNGTIHWTFSIPNSRGSIQNTPAIMDTLVYVGGQRGTHLYCLNARTGIEVWSYPAGSLYSRPATVDEGRVYVNAVDSLVCLDGATGSLLWGRGSETRQVPAIKGSILYAGLQSDTVTALDKVSGDLIWEVSTPVNWWGSFVAGDSLVYLISSSTDVKALRLEDGSEEWSRSFTGEQISSLSTGALAFANNLLYVSIWSDSAGNGKVYALGGDDGVPIWESSLDAEGAFSPVVANSVVYISDWNSGTLYALDALTGNRITTLPYLSREYIVSDGSLIALRFGTPELHILRMEPLGVGGKDEPSAMESPRAFSLSQNYPNPFNPSTTISYNLPQGGHCRLAIYDIRGRLVRELVDGEMGGGGYSVRWDGRDEAGQPVSSGVYFYRLQTEGFVRTRKLTVLK